MVTTGTAAGDAIISKDKQIRQLERELAAAKEWYDLGKLSTAIARGEAIPADAKAMDDNPVNCISFAMLEIERLKRQNARLQETQPTERLGCAVGEALTNLWTQNKQSNRHQLLVLRWIGKPSHVHWRNG
jgi:hypothetical protein